MDRRRCWLFCLVFGSILCVASTERVLAGNKSSHTNHTNGTVVDTSGDAVIKSVLFLFISFFVGAITRHFLTVSGLALPYTSIIFIMGGVLGVAGFYDHEHHKILEPYLGVAEMDAELMLKIFLPILVFESAFSMDAHMFTKVVWQVLILAGPGTITCTSLIAFYAKMAFSEWKWAWLPSFTFGCILSATDPVAVVALMKESGISSKVTTVVEGESLLNDAAVIVIFKVLVKLLGKHKDQEIGTEVAHSVLKMCFGAPVVGYVAGKIALMWILRIYKDEVLEFSITLCFSYITYYISESVLESSGVLSVLVLGIVMSYEKSNFSPETEEAVRKFWEMMSYYSNTIIFMIVGYSTSHNCMETKANFKEFGYSLFTYFFITIFRLLMILIWSPLLVRTGYGITWQMAIALTWGGLRGAVGMALAMDLKGSMKPDATDMVYANIMKQVAFVILLTLVVNATTMGIVLNTLGMKSITLSHRIAMEHAVSQLRDTASLSMAVQTSDNFLANSDRKWVLQNTNIKGPYAAEAMDDDDEDYDENYSVFRTMMCPHCEAITDVEPTEAEAAEMSEEARQRVLKSLKSLYWTYFENNVITRRTVQLLTAATNDALDNVGSYVEARHVKKKYMDISETVIRMMNKLKEWNAKIKMADVSEETFYLAGQTVEASTFRKYCILIYMWPLFLPIVFFFSVFNVAPVTIMTIPSMRDNITVKKSCMAAGGLVIAVYSLEALIKITALGFKRYWLSRWNKFAFIFGVVHGWITVFGDLASYYTKKVGDKNRDVFYYTGSPRFLRVLRILEMYPITLKLFADFLKYLEGSTAENFYDAYDIGFAYCNSQEEISKQTAFIKDYKEAGARLLQLAEENIQEMSKVMNDIQSNYPGVALALKSHKVATVVMNDVVRALNELRETGMIDESEYTCLHDEIDLIKQEISRSPKTLSTSDRAEDILSNIEWISMGPMLHSLSTGYTVREYMAGDTINNVGQPCFGISIITSGIAKVSGKIENVKKNSLPNTDSLSYFQSTGTFFEFVSVNHCLGILGFLGTEKYVTSAVCETNVRVIHLSQGVLKRTEVEMGSNSPLTYVLWREVAITIALPMISENVDFQSYDSNYVKLMLEKALIPDFSSALFFEIDPMVKAVILIQGKARDPHAGVIYMGPELIPSSVNKLCFDDDPAKRPRIVLLILADAGYKLDGSIRWAIDEEASKTVEKSGTLCLFHCVQHRRSTMGALFKDNPGAEMQLKRRQTGRQASSAVPLLGGPSSPTF